MPSLKEVKGRIASVSSTQQITKAMKMVSAAKLRKAQQRAWQLRPYATALQAILRGLLQDCDTEHALLGAAPNPQAPLLLVPIASDKGLCGAFNSHIIKATEEQMAKHAAETHLLPIGRRVYEYFQRRRKPLRSDYYQIFQDFHYDQIREVAQYLIQQYLEGQTSRILLIYNEAKHVAAQHLCIRTFLPFHLPEETTKTEKRALNYIYEPSESKIIESTLPLFLQTSLYQALAESYAAEHGARMTAMDKASENAEELLKELRLSYNSTRQAVITREILEIVSGADALKDT